MLVDGSALARLQVHYPTIPEVLCGTRKLAEEWTYRFLGAARAEAVGELEWGDPTDPAGHRHRTAD